jgi:calcineurin-like phosphoesterase family protein
MKIWFTADTHFGHLKIPYYARRMFCLDGEEAAAVDRMWREDNFRSDWRPSRASIARMDDHLIKNINDCVGKDDLLWHLGDFSFGGSKRDAARIARDYRERITCRNVFLVRGNHDDPCIYGVFDGCYERHELKFEKRQVVLSHYAQVFWNRSHYKSWMLYGHAHGTAEKWMDDNMPGRLSMDVGVDNVFRIKGEYRPISFDEIESFFSERSGFNVDGNSMKKHSANFTRSDRGL